MAVSRGYLGSYGGLGAKQVNHSYKYNNIIKERVDKMEIEEIIDSMFSVSVGSDYAVCIDGVSICLRKHVPHKVFISVFDKTSSSRKRMFLIKDVINIDDGTNEDDKDVLIRLKKVIQKVGSSIFEQFLIQMDYDSMGLL